ncbi:hypothetical protein GCM10022289_23620 [Pedobacter jeongneungensis]|uniref:OmpA-like domain-containing protein n=1 Tax=Pedobacter jeongneungensis TaxID=947309 RepID=A0ABP8BFS7_9SPHI
MAFDLNKNDGSKKERSKFDLSKGEIEKPAGRSRGWLIGLFGLLIIGGGIWYYSSGQPSDNIAREAVQDTVSAPDNAAASVAPIKANINSTDPTAPVNTSEIKEKSGGKTSAEAASPELKTAALKALNHTVPVTFVQGTSSFASINKPLIKRILAHLSKNPAASIHIDGYASSDGPIAVNEQISQARADAFKNHLTALNIEASRISATGKGIENPVASNNTAGGRKKNRRVEVTLL